MGKRADWLDKVMFDEDDSWSAFDKFKKIKDYLPDYDEGDNMANQASTAINKLIYRWFNDGDVYDNTRFSNPGVTDLSPYANWLASYIDGMDEILEQVWNCRTDEEYTRILYVAAEELEEVIDDYASKEKHDSVYECDGDFEIEESLTCPNCGGECDEYDLDQYGMCYDCWEYEQEQEDEDGDDEDY